MSSSLSATAGERTMPNRYLENRWDKKLAATLPKPNFCATAPTFSALICASPIMAEETPAPN